MNEFIKNHQEEFDKAKEFFQNELSKVRTGRANPALVEGVFVEAYGTPTPLKQLATVTVPEARVLRIEPWDKSLLKPIETALSKLEIGASTSVDDQCVRATFPQLTEESRAKFTKMIAEKLEEAKVSVRQIRDKVKEDIEKAFKNSDITEDDRYDYRDGLDKHIESLNKELDELAEKKSKEIMTI
ncbi:MAG: ribosome recycling factor [Patescibacteria group bacterium]